MKKIHSLIMIIYIIVFFGCGKEPVTKPNNVTNLGHFSFPFPPNNTIDTDLFLRLSWSYEGEYDYFKIYLDNNTIPYSQIGTTNENELITDELEANQRYFWKVVAVKKDEIDSLNIIETSSPIWNFKTKEFAFFSNPSPQHNAINQNLEVNLSWEFANEYDYFSIYFDNNEDPQVLLTNNLETPNFLVSNLDFDTTYYWRVKAVKQDSTSEDTLDTKEFLSPIWNFRTRNHQQNDGYFLYNKRFFYDYPRLINIMFDIEKADGSGVTNLNESNFTIKENNIPILMDETNCHIKSFDNFDYNQNTIFLIDNSIRLESSSDLINSALSNIISNMQNYQHFAICTFAEDFFVVQNFTNNTMQLLNAINNIHYTYSEASLYESLIEAVNLMNDSYNQFSVTQNNLIVITGGDDNIGTASLFDAENAVQNKRVFVIELFNPEESGIHLSDLAPYGLYRLLDYNNLETTLQIIMDKIIDFKNSFYYISYESIRRSGTFVLSLQIKDNFYTGEYSTITTSFLADGFSDATQGIYFNVTHENPIGIAQYNVENPGTQQLIAKTFLPDKQPHFEWSVLEDNFTNYSLIQDSIFQFYINSEIDSLSVTATDINNNVSKTIKIINIH